MGGNLEMLITKQRPKLKCFERKICNFLPILAKIIQSTLEQQHCHDNSGWLMGLVCIQNESLLVYSKSQKVSAYYCSLFQHSRGKNQPVDRTSFFKIVGINYLVILKK